MAPLDVTIDHDNRQLVITRVFDAPRELVFKTYTDPELIPQWWGVGGQTTVDVMDVRPGGRWRYVQRDAEGNEQGFRGEYRDVTPPERLSYTFEWEGMPGHIILETLVFDEQDGKTTIINTSRYDTLEDLEGMLQTGAEQGAAITWDRLAEVLKRLLLQQG